MKFKFKFILILILIVFLFAFLAISYNPTSVNNFFNFVFNPVDRSCKTDDNCAFRYPKCAICAPCMSDESWAVNKNWKPLCPIPILPVYACVACIAQPQQVFCQQGICKIIRVCTEEAKICPDGSEVGRNPKLNCEFNPCP